MDANNTVSSAVNAISDAPAFDEPYRFGRRPNTRAPFPFTEREFARLLIVRGRINVASARGGVPAQTSPHAMSLARQTAYRRLALTVLGVDVLTITAELRTRRLASAPKLRLGVWPRRRPSSGRCQTA